MKYSFNDILNDEFYTNSKVAIVTGPYNIFNNMVIDRFKKECAEENYYEVDSDTLSEFGIKSDDSEAKISNNVDFNTFMGVINIPSVVGKWFCSVDISIMSKKQMEILREYIKNPGDNGILIINSSEFKDYREFLYSNIVKYSKTCNLIQLSFPNRKTLINLVKQMFYSRSVQISEESASLFVMRMSSSYEEYNAIVDRVCEGYSDTVISYSQVKERLKGVENFVLDDFIEALLKPLSGEKITANRKIYKMYKMLMQEYGITKLLNNIMYKIDDYIQFRILINKGIIPIKVRFSVDEAKRYIGEEHKLYKMTEYKFRRMANIASLTSLRDWVYMKLILSKAKGVYTDEGKEKILYTLMHRSVLNKSRLGNNIGIENVIDAKIKSIDKIKIDRVYGR